MKKIFNLFLISSFVMLTPAVLAVNLKFNIGIEDKVFYPNETISMNVTVENWDTHTAKNSTLFLQAGKRNYTFEIGNLEPDEKFEKIIEMPKFPAGSYQAKGEFSYTGFLGEKFLETTYEGFKVAFPE